jgi:hypothetical protein
MISRELHIGSSAAQALVTKVVYKSFPFGGRITAARLGLSGTASAVDCIDRLWVSFRPAVVVFAHSVWVIFRHLALRSFTLPGLSLFHWALRSRVLPGLAFVPFSVTITLAFFAIAPLVPFTCTAFFTGFSVLCGHEKTPCSDSQGVELQSSCDRRSYPVVIAPQDVDSIAEAFSFPNYGNCTTIFRSRVV